MDKELVLHPEQGLVWKTVVENYEAADLGQLEGEVARHQEAVDALTTQQEALAADLSKAQSDLEDSKSHAERGRALVESQVADSSAEELGGEVSTDTIEELQPQY